MKTKKQKEIDRAVRAATFEVREGIRDRMRSSLRALVTSRGDDYGAGWNAALKQVESMLGESKRR